jgi:hypothetical protein
MGTAPISQAKYDQCFGDTEATVGQVGGCIVPKPGILLSTSPSLEGRGGRSKASLHEIRPTSLLKTACAALLNSYLLPPSDSVNSHPSGSLGFGVKI